MARPDPRLRIQEELPSNIAKVVGQVIMINIRGSPGEPCHSHYSHHPVMVEAQQAAYASKLFNLQNNLPVSRKAGPLELNW